MKLLSRIRVLVIDESEAWRETLRMALASALDVDLVSAVSTAASGRARIRESAPDIVVLAADTSRFSAAGFTREILSGQPGLGVLLTTKGGGDDAGRVIEALEAGAFDVVVKPGALENGGRTVEVTARRLLPKIRSLSAVKYSRQAQAAFGIPSARKAAGRREHGSDQLRRERRGSRGRGDPEILLIAASTGGPEALSRLLPALPRTLSVPVAIVQHIPKGFSGALASALDRKSRLTVKEGIGGELLLPGVAYLASGGSHLRVARNVGGLLVARTSDAPAEGGLRPSANVLFASAADVCRCVLALVLTGMGEDGVRGLSELARVEALVLAQDEASSVVWGMPGRAVRSGLVDEVLPLAEIPGRIVAWASP